MKLFNILSGNNLGLLMGMLTSGKIDMAKLMPIISGLLTPENIQQAIVELHKAYAQQLEKLPEGHRLKVVLEPDQQRGLKLVFWDYSPDNAATKAYDDIYLAEVTPEQLQKLLKMLFSPEQPQQVEVNTTIEGIPAADYKPVEPGAYITVGGQRVEPDNDDDIDTEIEDFENRKAD